MNKKGLKIILLVIGCILISFIIRALFITGLIYLIFSSSKVIVNEDIDKYNNFIGENANVEYKDKWGMDESIFPTKITDSMNVLDYKMVYYDPWDKQFLSYLVVEYNDDDYEKEVSRLEDYSSTPYIGYYNVEGFEYNLLAIYADSYNGFVYALTDNNNKIIYVELIFCNYFYDIDYEKYIPNEYLPIGFSAKLDNPYSKRMLKDG